jgi:hypothetical protein
VHGIDPEPERKIPGRKPKKMVPIWCRFRRHNETGWHEWRVWRRYQNSDIAKQAFKILKNKHEPFMEFSLTEPKEGP